MVWETVARRLQRSYGPSFFIMEFLPWSCTSIVFVQYWPSHAWFHHCAALGIRTDDLLGRRRHQGFTKSQKRGRLGSSCHASRSPPATGIGTEEATRSRRACSSSNVSPQTPSIRRCSSCIIFAVQPTRDGGNGQACCMSSLKETSNVVTDAGQAWRSTMRGLLRRHDNYHLGCLEVRSKGVVDLGEYLGTNTLSEDAVLALDLTHSGRVEETSATESTSTDRAVSAHEVNSSWKAALLARTTKLLLARLSFNTERRRMCSVSCDTFLPFGLLTDVTAWMLQPQVTEVHAVGMLYAPGLGLLVSRVTCQTHELEHSPGDRA